MAKTSSKAVKKPPGARPRVTRTDEQESESKRLFEEVLAPWPVRWRERKDYGLDGNIEITRPVPGTVDSEVTGREFAVQLKATDDTHAPASVSVETGHVRYWLEHTLPVLLVHAHLPSRRLRARWIDEHLFETLRSRNPAFWSQATVSIPLDAAFELDVAAKSDIEVAVTRKTRRALLSPSRFFELRRRVEAIAVRLDASGEAAGLESVRDLVQRTRKALKLSAYTVAITGPQRAGKSTLVNALLGLEVSPVADYPTTAVPIVFTSGEKSEAIVEFADRTTVTVAATAHALRPFAAQQEKTPDSRTVHVVRVTLPNDSLARGIALVDTPGRHDASKVVREVTDAALRDADAVLYVLDAGLGPKFKIGQHEVEDLQMLQGAKERLLVILNQSDLLDADRRASLAQYVHAELEKYGLGKGLPAPPLFVAGQEAWKARLSNSSPPPEFAALEEHLWGHLLRTRVSGLHRLGTGVGLMRTAAEQMVTLTAERSVKGKESADLANARRSCLQGVEYARKQEKETTEAAQRHAVALLKKTNKLYAVRWKLALASIPPNGAFPTNEAIHAQLVNDALDWRRRVWERLFGYLQAFSEELNELVRKALDDARVQLGLPTSTSMSFDAPSPSPFPSIDLSIPEAQFGFWGGLLGFLVNPVFGLVSTAASWLIGFSIGAPRRRERVLKRLSEEFNRRLLQTQKQILRQAFERFHGGTAELVQQVESRLGTFVRDAERRIARLGKPLSTAEADQLEQACSVATEVCKELDLIDEELRALLT